MAQTFFGHENSPYGLTASLYLSWCLSRPTGRDCDFCPQRQSPAPWIVRHVNQTPQMEIRLARSAYIEFECRSSCLHFMLFLYFFDQTHRYRFRGVLFLWVFNHNSPSLYTFLSASATRILYIWTKSFREHEVESSGNYSAKEDWLTCWTVCCNTRRSSPNLSNCSFWS